MTKAIVFVRARYKHVRIQNTGIETRIPKKRPCDTREVTIMLASQIPTDEGRSPEEVTSAAENAEGLFEWLGPCRQGFASSPVSAEAR
jgi:hypothetical protein